MSEKDKTLVVVAVIASVAFFWCLSMSLRANMLESQVDHLEWQVDRMRRDAMLRDCKETMLEGLGE